MVGFRRLSACAALLIARWAGVHAAEVTFDPAAALGFGSAFSFDTLKGTEASRIETVFDAMGGYMSTEHGFLPVTGTVLNGIAGTPAGLGSTYTLYFEFTDLAQGASLAVPGSVTAATFTLFAVAGASSFGTPGGFAAVDNHGNTPIAVFTTSFQYGVTGSTLVSFMPLTVDLNATLGARVVPIVPGFIAAPDDTLDSTLAAIHDHSGIDVENGGATFVLNSNPNDDTITFALPEPASFALLGAGLLAGLAVRRRS